MQAQTLQPREAVAFKPADVYEVVSNRTRRRLLTYLRVEAQPVDDLVLADEFQLSTLKLRHHLELLHRHGLVRLYKTDPNGWRVSFSRIGWARLRRQWQDAPVRSVGMGLVV